MILGKWQWVFCLFGGSVPSLGQAVWRRDWKGGQWAKKITRISTTCLEPWVHQHPVCLFVFVCYIHIKNCVCVLCVEQKQKQKKKHNWVGVLSMRTWSPLKQKGGTFMQCGIRLSPELSVCVLTSWLSQKLWLPCYITLHVALPLEREGEGAALKLEPPLSGIMWTQWLKPAIVTTCTCNSVEWLCESVFVHVRGCSFECEGMSGTMWQT